MAALPTMESPYPSSLLQKFIPSSKPILLQHFLRISKSYSDPEERLSGLFLYKTGEWFLPIAFDQDAAEVALLSPSSIDAHSATLNPAFFICLDSSFGGITQHIFAPTDEDYASALEPSLQMCILADGPRHNLWRIACFPERFRGLIEGHAEANCLSFIYEAPSNGFIFPETGVFVSEQHSLSATQIVVKRNDSEAEEEEEEIFEFGPLKMEDAEQVNDNWPYKSEWSINLVNYVINNRQTICARRITPGSSELAGWFVEYHDASVGMLFTMEKYRRRGLAAHLAQRMDELLRQSPLPFFGDAEGLISPRRGFFFVMKANQASTALFEQHLKCQRTREYTWIGFRKIITS